MREVYPTVFLVGILLLQGGRLSRCQRPPRPLRRPPVDPFQQVAELLKEDKGNAALLNRLSPLFDLRLFPSESSVETTFEEHLSKSVVLDLHDLPTDTPALELEKQGLATRVWRG